VIGDWWRYRTAKSKINLFYTNYQRSVSVLVRCFARDSNARTLGGDVVKLKGDALQMQSDCPTAKGRFQFLFFLRQRRRKILFRRDPRLELECNTEDDFLDTKACGGASIQRRIENARSRMGWGITHI
jgi:hypothetical protein